MIVALADVGNWSLRVNNPNGLSSNTFGFTVVAPALTLTVNPSSGPQLTTTFTVSGSGYTPNGSVRRFAQLPGEGWRDLGSITATSIGTISWPFTPACNHPVGNSFVYVIDSSTGRQSPTVTENVTRHPSCP